MKKFIFIFIFAGLFGFCLPALADDNPPYQPESVWVPEKYKRVHSAKLRWKEPTTKNANFYKVILRTGGKKAAKVGRWNNVTNLQRNVGGLKGNKLYKFRVRACKTEKNCSAPTKWVFFRTVPPQVDRVWVRSVSYICARIKLDRVPRDRKANTGYQINLYDKNMNFIKYVQTAYLRKYRKKGYPICGLEEETKYYVKARAQNSNGDKGKLSPRKRFYTEKFEY